MIKIGRILVFLLLWNVSSTELKVVPDALLREKSEVPFIDSYFYHSLISTEHNRGEKPIRVSLLTWGGWGGSREEVT